LRPLVAAVEKLATFFAAALSGAFVEAAPAAA
jgi:hypothetical protein